MSSAQRDAYITLRRQGTSQSDAFRITCGSVPRSDSTRTNWERWYRSAAGLPARESDPRKATGHER